MLCPIARGDEPKEPAIDFDGDVVWFVEDYCDRCHGRRKPKGDLSLHDVEGRGDVLNQREAWKKVLDAAEGFEMPPESQDQPTVDERARFVRAVRTVLATPEFGEGRNPGRTPLRRLTRLEYNNTVRDLLGLDTDVFLFSERLPFDKSYFVPARGKLPDRLDIPAREYGAKRPVLLPDAGLPGDSRAEHGFTNRGDVQNLSSVRLEQYMKLAGEIMHHPELLRRAERMEEIFPGAKFQPRLVRGRRKAPRQAAMSSGDVQRRCLPR